MRERPRNCPTCGSADGFHAAGGCTDPYHDGNPARGQRPSRIHHPIADRFWEKVDRQGSGDCWAWKAGFNDNGYGAFYLENGRAVMAHRQAYELLVGEIPGGLCLDHLCRNRSCVNPAHLEPVTNAENVLRGEAPSARNARKTHCVHGHEFTPENTIRWPSNPRKRVCRSCRRRHERERVR